MHRMISDGMVVQLRGSMNDVLGAVGESSMGYSIFLRVERSYPSTFTSAMASDQL